MNKKLLDLTDEDVLAYLEDIDQLCKFCEMSQEGCTGEIKPTPSGEPLFPRCTEQHEFALEIAREVKRGVIRTAKEREEKKND